MHRSWLGRATVLLLIAGILGGGSGAPVVDALLFHTRPGAATSQAPHFEPQGSRHAHADKCTLGQLLRVQPSASASFEPAIVAAQSLTVARTPYASSPRATRFFTPQHSRAPPARSA